MLILTQRANNRHNNSRQHRPKTSGQGRTTRGPRRRHPRRILPNRVRRPTANITVHSIPRLVHGSQHRLKLNRIPNIRLIRGTTYRRRPPIQHNGPIRKHSLMSVNTSTTRPRHHTRPIRHHHRPQINRKHKPHIRLNPRTPDQRHPRHRHMGSGRRSQNRLSRKSGLKHHTHTVGITHLHQTNNYTASKHVSLFRSDNTPTTAKGTPTLAISRVSNTIGHIVRNRFKHIHIQNRIKHISQPSSKRLCFSLGSSGTYVTDIY